MDEVQMQLQLKTLPISLHKFALWMVSKPLTGVRTHNKAEIKCCFLIEKSCVWICQQNGKHLSEIVNI